MDGDKLGTVALVVLGVIWAIGVYNGLSPAWPLNLVLNILAAFGIGYGTSGGL